MKDSFDQIPQQREAHQRWVFVLFESPHHSPNFKNLNDFFNLTTSFRVDASFVDLPGISWTRKPRNNFYDERVDYLAGKTKFAVAIISNCGGSSKRLELIKSLQTYVQVDLFGSCGKSCPNRYSGPNEASGECKDIVCKEYKFYFSFENSVCKDYVTEKFFDSFLPNKHPIVPVVLGGADYSLYVSGV